MEEKLMATNATMKNNIVAMIKKQFKAQGWFQGWKKKVLKKKNKAGYTAT